MKFKIRLVSENSIWVTKIWQECSFEPFRIIVHPLINSSTHHFWKWWVDELMNGAWQLNRVFGSKTQIDLTNRELTFSILPEYRKFKYRWYKSKNYILLKLISFDPWEKFAPQKKVKKLRIVYLFVKKKCRKHFSCYFSI